MDEKIAIHEINEISATMRMHNKTEEDSKNVVTENDFLGGNSTNDAVCFLYTCFLT